MTLDGIQRRMTFLSLDILPPHHLSGLPWSSVGKESACNTGEPSLISGLGRPPGERIRLPTPVFWPREFHGLHSPRGHKESDMTKWLSLYQYLLIWLFSSVQFSCSVMSDSSRPHESQHARPPCPSPSPGVHSDSRPSSPWCHPAISSSVALFSSCPQSLPASGSFPMSPLHEVAKVLEFQL